MYTMKEIFGVPSVKGEIVKRVETVVFNADDSVDEIGIKIENIISESRLMVGVPSYVSIVTTHLTAGKVSSVKVTLKLRKRDMLEGSNLKASLSVPYDSSFKTMLINFVASWVDNYFVMLRAQANIDELNEVVAGADGAVSVSFVLGNDVVRSITDNAIVLEIPVEVAANISTMNVFSSVDIIRELRRNNVITEIQSFTNACEVLKSKSEFFKSIGVYSRAEVASVLKKVYRKDVTSAVDERTTCKFEYKDEKGKFFGLFDKVKLDAVAEDEVPDFTNNGYAYFVVLSPFGNKGKNFISLDKDDAVELLKSVIA